MQEQGKLKGQITLISNKDGAILQLRDCNSTIGFLEIYIKPEDLCHLIGGQGRVDCDFDIYLDNRIGKKHENKKFEFEIESRDLFSHELKAIADSQLTDGWIADKYFSSQDSFFTKDGKQYARCTIRRWV
jgi:hypothetical protein